MIKLAFFLVLLALSDAAMTSIRVPCRADSDCQRMIPDDAVKCINTACMCPENSKYSPDGCKRRSIPPAGRSFEAPVCETDEDCKAIEGAICEDAEFQTTNKKCVCDKGKMMNENNTKCLAKAEKINEDCEETIQCSNITGATCSEKTHKCECNDKAHYVEESGVVKAKMCLANKGLGESCKPDENSCYQLGRDNENALHCSKKTEQCECAKNYKLIDNQCQSSGAAQILTSAALHFLLAFAILMIAV